MLDNLSDNTFNILVSVMQVLAVFLQEIARILQEAQELQ